MATCQLAAKLAFLAELYKELLIIIFIVACQERE